MNLQLRFVIFIVAATCTFASPLQAGSNGLQDEYPASSAEEYLSRYLEGRSKPEVGSLDRSHLPRQARRGLDSLSGVTFGQSKRRGPSSALRGGGGGFDEIDRSVFDRFVKRNIDEIDRTAFDNFFKRNFDEIDRSDFNGFVKRLDNYFTNRQRRR